MVNFVYFFHGYPTQNNNHYSSGESIKVKQIYVQFDSLYANKKLIDTCNTNGFHVIATFKSHPMMYQAGGQVKVSNFV